MSNSNKGARCSVQTFTCNRYIVPCVHTASSCQDPVPPDQNTSTGVVVPPTIPVLERDLRRKEWHDQIYLLFFSSCFLAEERKQCWHVAINFIFFTCQGQTVIGATLPPTTLFTMGALESAVPQRHRLKTVYSRCNCYLNAFWDILSEHSLNTSGTVEKS